MFVDLGESRAKHSESPVGTSFPGTMTNLAMCLMATALIGSSVVGWRLISVWEKQHEQVQESNRDFNKELVEAVHTLAENAGVLTSADLCPIKFRLRSEKEHSTSPPARTVTAELRKATDSGDYAHLTNCNSRPSGLLDFGLHEPGQYRLRIKMPDGMSILHDFEVLPGVPVDRLVRFPGGSPNGEEFSLALEWPRELAQERVAAICRMEPCGTELEEWNWSAPAGASGELLWSQNCELRPGDAAVADILPCETIPMLGETEAKVPLYCRYWELAEIVFVRLSDSEESSACVVLGSDRFGGGVDDEATLVGGEDYCPVWVVSGERPDFEAKGKVEWTLPLPSEIVKHLKGAIDRSDTTADRVDPSSENGRRQYFDLSGRTSRWSIESLACWDTDVR